MTDETCWESAAAALGGRRAVCDFSAGDREVLLQWALRSRLAAFLWRLGGPAPSPVERPAPSLVERPAPSLVEGRGPDGVPVDPGAARDGWLDAACRQAAYTVYQEQELRRVVDEFARACIPP